MWFLEYCKFFFLNYSWSMLWIVFVVLFFVMAWKERQKSRFNLKSLQPAQFSHIKIKIGNVDFEEFSKELQKSNQDSHRTAAISYFLAGLTALGSLVVTLFQ